MNHSLHIQALAARFDRRLGKKLEAMNEKHTPEEGQRTGDGRLPLDVLQEVLETCDLPGTPSESDAINLAYKRGFEAGARCGDGISEVEKNVMRASRKMASEGPALPGSGAPTQEISIMGEGRERAKVGVWRHPKVGDRILAPESATPYPAGDYDAKTRIFTIEKTPRVQSGRWVAHNLFLDCCHYADTFDGIPPAPEDGRVLPEQVEAELCAVLRKVQAEFEDENFDLRVAELKVELERLKKAVRGAISYFGRNHSQMQELIRALESSGGDK